MEQVYFLRNNGEDLPECLYQYGNYTYDGQVEVEPPKSPGELPKALMDLQAVQNSIPFHLETKKIPSDTD